MPRKEYSFEIRDRAEELYVIDGLTFEEVAAETGVALNTVKKWATAEAWRTKREEYRVSLRDIKSSIVKTRKKLWESAAKKLDLQSIFAAAKLEAIALKLDKKETVQVEMDRPKIFLEDMEFIARSLQEIDPEGLKVFARNFQTIVDRFKADAQAA